LLSYLLYHYTSNPSSFGFQHIMSLLDLSSRLVGEDFDTIPTM
jgi:hypothetical protein